MEMQAKIRNRKSLKREVLCRTKSLNVNDGLNSNIRRVNSFFVD
jgi:hypothetical protein